MPGLSPSLPVGRLMMPPLPFTPEQLQWFSRQRQLSQIIEAHLTDHALNAVTLSDDDRQKALQAFVEENGIENHEKLEQFRLEKFLVPADFQFLVERPLRLKLLCKKNFFSKIEERFLERKTALDRVVYSLIRVEAEGLARELYLRIAGGEASFSQLAADFSQGPERQTAGIVGPVPMLQAHPALAQLLRISPPGVLLEPFAIEQWWLVVRVENYSPAVLDDSTREMMARELFNDWMQAEVRQVLESVGPQLLREEKEFVLP
jgi:parvulin-like peptidyl-prolyl isomerase